MAQINQAQKAPVQPAVVKEEAKKNPPNMKYMRDKDREMVKGVFRFHEVPGGSMNFVFRKYKEDQVERYDMVDGQIYTIPLGVAKHLNKNVSYPIHAFLEQENGPTIKVGKTVRRCSFQSLEFIDIDDLSPDGSPLVTVEYTSPGV